MICSFPCTSSALKDGAQLLFLLLLRDPSKLFTNFQGCVGMRRSPAPPRRPFFQSYHNKGSNASSRRWAFATTAHDPALSSLSRPRDNQFAFKQRCCRLPSRGDDDDDDDDDAFFSRAHGKPGSTALRLALRERSREFRFSVFVFSSRHDASHLNERCASDGIGNCVVSRAKPSNAYRRLR